MRRKWEKSTEKWHIFFQNLLFDKSTFQNWIESYRSTQRPSRALYTFSDFYIIPCLSVFLNFRWCSAEGDIIHSSHCGKLPPSAHVRAPYSNFALFAFTTFTLSPFICLDFPLISRHYPLKISNVFRKNSYVFSKISHVFWEISHVFSNISESCGQHSDLSHFLPLIHTSSQLSLYRFFHPIFLDFLLFSLIFLNECK